MVYAVEDMRELVRTTRQLIAGSRLRASELIRDCKIAGSKKNGISRKTLSCAVNSIINASMRDRAVEEKFVRAIVLHTSCPLFSHRDVRVVACFARRVRERLRSLGVEEPSSQALVVAALFLLCDDTRFSNGHIRRLGLSCRPGLKFAQLSMDYVTEAGGNKSNALKQQILRTVSAFGPKQVT